VEARGRTAYRTRGDAADELSVPRVRATLAGKQTFAGVAAIGRALPDVEVTTAWGQPALKVRGKMFVCIASHKSAEPNSLVVMMAVADRDALVEDDPATYYLKEHYVNHPCVLVRLTRIHPEALRDLVVGAHRFVEGQMRRKPGPVSRRGTARPSRGRR
jgi:hypothetical protein